MIGSVMLPDDLVFLAKTYRADGVHLCWESRAARPHRLLDKAAIDRLRDALLVLTLWHEEREDELQALVALGPDAICTNTPAALRRIVDAHPGVSLAQQGSLHALQRQTSTQRTAIGPGRRLTDLSAATPLTLCTHTTIQEECHELRKLAIAGMLVGALIGAAAPTCVAEDVVIKVWSRAGPLPARCARATSWPRATRSTRCSPRSTATSASRSSSTKPTPRATTTTRWTCSRPSPSTRARTSSWPTSGPAPSSKPGTRSTWRTRSPRIPSSTATSSRRSGRRVRYKGARYEHTQDSEVRMFFLNNDKLRKLRRGPNKDIAALPGKVDAGQFTANDLCDLAGQAVQRGVRRNTASCTGPTGTGLPDDHRHLRPRPLRQGDGEAAGVEGGAARVLHVGQILRRQEGAVAEQPQCHGTRSSSRRSAARNRWCSSMASGV